MSRKLIHMFLTIFMGLNSVYAQIEFIGDTIDVGINGYKGGTIQWQFSTDNQTWNDIKGANLEKLKYKISETGYIRSTYKNCNKTYFSDTKKIEVDNRIHSFPTEEKYKFQNRTWQGIPSIERTPNGRLWATWYSGGTGEGIENYVILIYSDDSGKTWTEPILIIDPPGNIRAFDSNLWYGPDKRLWFFWSESNNWYDGRAGVWAINTEMITAINPHWSSPKRISDGIMMNKPIVARDSTILYPIGIWASPMNHPQTGSNIFYSKDKGKSINYLSNIFIQQSDVTENMIIEKNNQSLWMLTRTRYGIGEATSINEGKSWINIKRSNINHASSRFYIRKLKSGNILLIHHNSPQNDLSRSYLTASLSDDDGQTWRYNLLIDERLGVSYPDATSEDGNGNINMIYDYDRYGKKNILMCRFTEKSILNGHFFDSDLKPFVIIEKK